MSASVPLAPPSTSPDWTCVVSPADCPERCADKGVWVMSYWSEHPCCCVHSEPLHKIWHLQLYKAHFHNYSPAPFSSAFCFNLLDCAFFLFLKVWVDLLVLQFAGFILFWSGSISISVSCCLWVTSLYLSPTLTTSSWSCGSEERFSTGVQSTGSWDDITQPVFPPSTGRCVYLKSRDSQGNVYPVSNFLQGRKQLQFFCPKWCHRVV